MSTLDEQLGATGGAIWRSHIGIPVRSLWVLLVYASDLARFVDLAQTGAEDDASLPDLLARLLSFVVERRLRRSLSRGYRQCNALLTRVRGRIDWLETESGLHLQRGQIACRFEELTHDTPRNRLVRAALSACSSVVADKELAVRCRGLANDLGRLGVSENRPTRSEMARDQIARHDADDRVMVTIARLAMDLVLPSEFDGSHHTSKLDRDERLLRRIFEGAVAGFYKHELAKKPDWKVRAQHPLKWSTDNPTDGVLARLPSMSADIILDHRPGRRVVIDTKFTDILTPRFHGGSSFKSTHIYQLYAYLRSQAGLGDPAADGADGLLLYPSMGVLMDEAVTVQGHRIRFATVDLAADPHHIERQLREVVFS